MNDKGIPELMSDAAGEIKSGQIPITELLARTDRAMKKITDPGATVKELNKPYENDIRRFVDAMRYKLAKNAKKGRWENMDLNRILSMLRDEVDELADATKEGNTVEILLEAADVANFALIAASIAIEKGK